ncbi:SAM-dependent methyltransferase [Streptomyces durbertensis]|uniref:S-adenosyl-L-methionine-dependent methyltransferase n=1 Tax=Streptomyces durbertensis TaxID=2448886 RepID=A0ABR6EMA2_9ACTN|nr:SAM-dependent methyltransferase [Streptomyces durbertensis]MBB1246472.1 SAM-dependent methyltransferase [Streptomyces durbertensis]
MTAAPPPTRLQSGQSSETAHLTARARAADAVVEPARRLLGDTHAHLFVTVPPPATAEEALGRLRSLDRAHGGFLAEILLRQRYFEDLIALAVDAGVRQVVLLGAGYDTTALRHTGPGTVRFFEVDHPATQTAKLAALAAADLVSPAVPVPLDLTAGASLRAELTAHGFDVHTPCVVGWLGVTFFLPPEACRATLAELADTVAPGSLLLFDYMDEAVVDGTSPWEGALRMARQVRELGEPYVNGLTADTAATTARDAGFEPVEHLRVTDLVRRYGGTDPYCSDDDFMGLVAARRTGREASGHGE